MVGLRIACVAAVGTSLTLACAVGEDANTSTPARDVTASESRVRDADIAALSSKMASFQILQQAGTSVLAQANQSAQSVLNLLR